MTVREVLDRAEHEPRQVQLFVNAFIDAFRHAGPDERAAMVVDGPGGNGAIEGLFSAIVSVLCRETGTHPPDWVRYVHSPEPFFVFPARDYALRIRLMLESHPAFRARNVFVPENYLSRA